MYEVGDKVIYQGADKNAYKKVGVLKSIEEKDGKPQLTVEFEGGETFTAPVDDWSKEFTNAVRNGAYDTLIIKKVPQYGNKWCIFSDGSSNRLVPRVFDSPEWAKKYIKEDLPAWADAKIRVRNSCVSTNSIVRNAISLLNRKVVKNDAYSDYMRFVNKWRGVVADMERKLQSCKREAPSDATLVVSGQIDDAINEVHTVSQWLENTRYLSREDFEF